MQLRHAGFVHADLGADLLHRDFAVVVKADDLTLAPRQRLNRNPDTIARFDLFVRGVGRVGLRGDEYGGQTRLVEMLTRGERRRRFDGVDANDRPAQALFVGSDPRGQVSHGRLVSELAAERLASGIQFPALTSNTTRPRILAECVDHRAAHPPLGEGLEFDAPSFIEPVRRVD